MRLYDKCRVRVDNNRVWPVMTKQVLHTSKDWIYLSLYKEFQVIWKDSQCYGI